MSSQGSDDISRPESQNRRAEHLAGGLMSAILHLAYVPVLMLLSVNETRSEAGTIFKQTEVAKYTAKAIKQRKRECSRYLCSS